MVSRPGVAAARGFTLTELAVVFAIISLLLAAGLFTLSAQTDQRNFDETRRRLEAARELVLGFAIVNGRLPCPATAASLGNEAPVGGGACTAPYGGFLPARSIGFQITDTAGFAVDAWGNRIRYSVSAGTSTATLTGCVGSNLVPHFTSTANLKTNGVTCQPNDLIVCNTATGIGASSCASASNEVTNKNALVAIMVAPGKNGALGASGIDEAANLDTNSSFVWHPPTPAGSANGEFDDQVAWVAATEFYGKLVLGGVLP
jgi:prepilin-type N-terminal cleavage/methylation domain-containing protein